MAERGASHGEAGASGAEPAGRGSRPAGRRPFGLAVALGTAALLGLPIASHAIVAMSRDDIIAKAATGVGSPYWWGHACWRSWDEDWGGADCSGYVGRVWNVPIEVASDYDCDYHPYGTWHFKNESTHWSSIDRSDLERGDAMVRNDGTSGHIVIYASGDPWGCQEIYEAQCTACGIRHHTRCLDNTYVARRRDNLDTCSPSSEVCDGADNDCDGSVDEGNPGGGGSCNTGEPGLCASGVKKCVGGGLTCEQTVLPVAEACDGVDNDCDGTVDEGVCHDAEIVSHTVPADIVACRAVEVDITLRNSGTSTWSDADGFGLRYESGTISAPDWLAVGDLVAPGGQATFHFSIVAPTEEGTASARWRMERGTAGFGDALESTLAVSPPEFRAEVLDRSFPLTLHPGEVGQGWFSVRNTGASAWPANAVVLGTSPAGARSPLWTPSWVAFDAAARLSSEVPPGSQVQIAFEVGCGEGCAGGIAAVFELRDPTGEMFVCGATGMAVELNGGPPEPDEGEGGEGGGGAAVEGGDEPVVLVHSCGLAPAASRTAAGSGGVLLAALLAAAFALVARLRRPKARAAPRARSR